jgi:hypothetical protein
MDDRINNLFLAIIAVFNFWSLYVSKGIHAALTDETRFSPGVSTGDGTSEQRPESSPGC